MLLIGSGLLLIAGCGQIGGGGDSEPADAPTSLEITVWPQGDGGPTRTWTLTCDPPGGTLPRARNACSRLTPRALRPLPQDAICTQIYGGPQKARVTGRFEGRAIDERFGRTNGCEIHRWDGLRFLFPVRI